jgi:hypothetical protein
MIRRFRVLLSALAGGVLVAIVAWVVGFQRPVVAQATVYEGLLLCSMPGATKEEALWGTGHNTLFNETFTVRTRNWRYLANAKLWHGEWWLRDPPTGNFMWVPVATSLPCNYYPSNLNTDWIVE